MGMEVRAPAQPPFQSKIAKNTLKTRRRPVLYGVRSAVTRRACRTRVRVPT